MEPGLWIRSMESLGYRRTPGGDALHGLALLSEGE